MAKGITQQVKVHEDADLGASHQQALLRFLSLVLLQGRSDHGHAHLLSENARKVPAAAM